MSTHTYTAPRPRTPAGAHTHSPSRQAHDTARLLPRWLAVAGLVLAAVAELATLTLLFNGAAYPLLVARIGGLLWLIAAAAVLPKCRPAANA